MTQGVIPTKGTRLYFAVSASEIHKVACPTGFTGLGGAAQKIITTCMESEREESIPGERTNNPLSVPINFINQSAAHQALMALEQNDEEVAWLLVDSDQDGEPTALDSDGYLVSPGPTTRGFKATVANLEFNYELNNIKRATLTIQPSGGFVDDLPTAIYA